MLQNSSIPEITSTPEITIFPERTELPENMHKKLQNANDIIIEKNIYTDNDETINKKVSITYPSFTLPGVDMSFINDSIKKFIFDTFGDV